MACLQDSRRRRRRLLLSSGDVTSGEPMERDAVKGVTILKKPLM
jgi:hypothetical protein